MLANLNHIFKGYAGCLAAFNVFGYEDAAAVVRAAETKGVPACLMTNKPAVTHMPIPILGEMLCYIAKRSTVPVCVHLDHSSQISDIELAAESGYTSVMFDGSLLDFAENVRLTKNVIEKVRPLGISVEAEIGSVGYWGIEGQSTASFTKPSEAKQFYKETGVDALAVAVGTVHRMTSQKAAIQFDRLLEIRNQADVPLVLHGSSGVAGQDLFKLATAGIRKINLGTCLRQAFGNTMRKAMEEDKTSFDRIQIFKPAMEAVFLEVVKKIDAINGVS